MINMKFPIIAAMLLGSALNAGAQTVDELVSKNLAAVGGADKWRKVTTLTLTGSMSMQGMDIPVTITTKHGRGQRVEYTVNGMTGYQIVTRTNGWAFGPGMSKAQALPEDLVKQSQDGLEIQGELLDYKAKGTKVEYTGKEKVDGTDCYKLHLTFASGMEETMYLDANTYYHVRTVKKVKDAGNDTEQVSVYGGYKKLAEGIMFPMTEDDGSGLVTLKSVEVNKPVDEAIFAPKN